MLATESTANLARSTTHSRPVFSQSSCSDSKVPRTSPSISLASTARENLKMMACDSASSCRAQRQTNIHSTRTHVLNT